MKIVCDACQAKYSISDDKVQGKVFKIRCKKCSNIIVVRGGAGAAEPAAPPTQEKETRVYDYGYEGGDQPPAGDESVWHVVINQDQVGPMTAAEVQQRFAAGEIDGETYAWREGFADWLPLSQVDTFAAYVASGSTTAAVTGVASGASAVAAMFSGGGEETGTTRSDPGDLFAAASASSHSSEDDGGDLFGSKPAKASSTAATEAANAKLRGERNENSVLFSLNNLAQLASDKPVSATPQASNASAGAGHATGAAGGEGSGLIDIRSMANAYLGGGGGGASKPATSSAIGSIDDLPVFGGGGFSEPAVIVPTARAQSNSKLMYALIGSVGLLAVAAVILVVVLVKGGDKKPAVVATSDDVAAGSSEKVPDKGSVDETKPPESGTAPVADPGSGKTADPPPSEPAKEPAKPADPPPKKEPKKPRTASRNEPKPREPSAPAVKEPASSGGCDEVSCVLNNYEGSCCARYKKGGSKPSGGGAPSGGSKSDLPDSLDRSMISEGVAKVKARIQTCGDKSSAKGTVNVSVKVSASGGVTSVKVNSSPETALGNCVASAMQRATFKKTQNGGSFRYPAVF